uniref:DNA repair endonuclease XPF putative n=1 Tax=Albugo laibachii Nc14 TaxID=890382 RepID=F0WGS9_9STRA|nr:DNA repair endonuclease XPF putative [Albugo laibachii Nc14]|eukprot:CCA20443.1 DNA repair endonuclease XPF putative [Albugo laibachii Nc14]
MFEETNASNLKEESNSFRKWLPFEKDIFEELYDEDALLVMGKGLGLSRILTCFIRMHCSREHFVICLNMNDHAVNMHQILISRGVTLEALPKVIDAKTSVHDRTQLYKLGGCYLITSRILVVDFLLNRLDSKRITGLLVHDAHRVTETSIEAFAVRLYREQNRFGFVKAFSDDAVTLSCGFNRMEQALRNLYLRQAVLYPRFHVSIHRCFQAKQPTVYEIAVDKTPPMKAIQDAILIAIEATLKEIQRSTRYLGDMDLSMDAVMEKSFLSFIRRQLDPNWHKLSAKTKQLVSDLGTLRQLLGYLMSYDAISFYDFLLNHETVSGQQRVPSPWLFTEAADMLYTSAKERVFQVMEKNTGKSIHVRGRGAVKSSQLRSIEQVELRLTLECNPKWEALAQTLDEIEMEREKEAKSTFWGEGCVLVMVKDDRTCAQLLKFLSLGGKEMMKQQFGQYAMRKEAFIRRKLGKRSKEMSLGLEQQLLIQHARKFAEAQKAHSNTVIAMQQDCKSDSNMATRLVSKWTLKWDQQRQERVKRFKSSSFSTISSDDISDAAFQLNQPDKEVLIYSYDQVLQNGQDALCFLNRMLPRAVILYDPNMTFIRELEMFHASQDVNMEVYFMLYHQSVEEKMYLQEISQEKSAFERLIHQKAHLVIPSATMDVPFDVKMRSQHHANAYSMDTRTGGRANQRLKKLSYQVIVDIREFRSALPSMLHKKALKVVPITLEVGDYILSPAICVERKSVSDLFGSLNSGRLYNQVEQMMKHYKIPVVLIEFSEKKAFALQDPSEITNTISASNIISKLVLLLIHFPTLRLLWSRSPHTTVDLFKVIKKNLQEPDVKVAAAIGSGIDPEHSAKFTESSTLEAMEREQMGYAHAETFYNVSSVEILQKLPGITQYNYRHVLSRVKTLAELSNYSIQQCIQLVGQIQGTKLYEFFNRSF